MATKKNTYERDSMSMISEIIDSDNQNRFYSENSESLESLCTSLAALSTAPKGQGMWRDRYTIYLYIIFPFLPNLISKSCFINSA